MTLQKQIHKKITPISALCVFEPRGDYGLEGYQKGGTYKAEYVVSTEITQPLGTKQCKRYYRVYPNPHDSYYECCSYRTFNKYFVGRQNNEQRNTASTAA